MFEAYLQLMIWAIVVPMLFLAVERLVPAETGQPHRRFVFNLLYAPAIFSFAFLVLLAGDPVFAAARDATGGGLLPRFGGPHESIGEQILLAFAYAFALDLFLYVLHRLQHSLPFLWETHRMHHDETALNAATYARAHALNMLLVILFQIPLAALFGSQYPTALGAFLMLRFWGYLIHANLRIGFGRLTPLLAGPQWHRIHHSTSPEHRDRNFAGMFPLIDIAFGTYYRPRPGEYPPTGLGGEPVSSWFAATAQPFVNWWRMLRVLPSRRSSVAVDEAQLRRAAE